MAFATEDLGWGRVEILHDGQSYRNIHIARVQFQNASSRDLTDMDVSIVTNPGTIVLRSEGLVRGSVNVMPFSGHYLRILSEATNRTLTPQELAYARGRSEFRLGVLNRGAIADFTLLLSRSDHETPAITLACDHVGIRLHHQPPVVEIFKVRQEQAVVVGLFIGGACVAGIISSGAPTWAVGAVSWVLGLGSMIVGAMTARVWRAVMKAAD